MLIGEAVKLLFILFMRQDRTMLAKSPSLSPLVSSDG
ncbi:hypothetical protein GGE12_005380 [Rhizobium mongolense]|uniref:Uncharacterized protein n=1 Tax=Rhizobium mongolense TaxID=57676 RepID=A0A7W6RS27_9HYPH|nr:hypothetical protein [Rhizobium mongolense]